ncbi:MAG TPA: YrdB family protein [Bacillota bacterium]|nr:YrdB family protein [Bacillota bacterium]
MKPIALALAFILELVAFIQFASIGQLLRAGPILHGILFIGLISAVLVFWSVFMAPKAPKKLHGDAYYVAKTLIYAVAATAIYRLHGPGWGGAFIFAALLDEAVLYKHNIS